MKKKSVLVLSLAFLFADIFQVQAKRVEKREIGEENSWKEVFDINDHKKGKYNVMVEADDGAGNRNIAGPYNIYIDPKSDLPVTGITNPSDNQRVPGNLNIVGTCVDDDKVSEVYLILDGDEANPVLAEGTEFWSYFLNTSELKEGPHTIEVYGVDNGNPDAYRREDGSIDESKVRKKTGERVKVTWQLDRRVPAIEITSHTMGQLVSGKINLQGHVSDGNGIRKFEYSIDGKHYTEIKVKERRLKEPTAEGLTSIFDFDFAVSTPNLEDGAATLYFKATDGAGSIGRFTYLCFVDNTKPDVKIISPKENETMNGVFTVAGYAKDKIGIKSLTWQWGNETGEFELTPGNPYFVKEIDSRGKGKSEIFSVTATDVIGNTVSERRVIPLNQEDDKPVVEISYPQNGIDIDGGKESVFLRGLASDDDGVVSVTYRLDGKDEVTVSTDGVFFADIDEELDFGNHVLTVWATDKYGIKGNPVTSVFTSRGKSPSFTEEVYRIKGNPTEFRNGLLVNPEDDGNYEVKVNSLAGLKNVSYRILWGNDGEIRQDFELNSDKAYTVKIPFSGEDVPWGVARLEIAASDSFGRKSLHNAIIRVRDLTRLGGEKGDCGVYFDDSTIGPDGSFRVNPSSDMTGYFVGSRIVSVSLNPPQRGVTVRNEGHVITLHSAVETQPFEVQVTDSTGATYTSRKLSFYRQKEKPVLTLNRSSEYDSANGLPYTFETASQVLKISGTVSDPSCPVRYRIFSAKANFPAEFGGLLASSEALPAGDFKDVRVSSNGSWALDDLGIAAFPDGVSVVEIFAGDDNLNAAEAVFVKKIPLAPSSAPVSAKGKTLSKDIPRLYWFKGRDYYGVCVYQGTMDSDFKYVRKENIRSDETALYFTAKTLDSLKETEYSAQPLPVSAEVDVEMAFVSCDGVNYSSGMPVVMNRGSSLDGGHSIILSAKSNGELKNLSYTIDGEDAPGGQAKQNGTVPLNPVNVDEESGIFEYEAEIPLENLPSRITRITASCSGAKGTSRSISGSIAVLRSHSVFDNEEKIYWIPSDKCRFDENLKAYILSSGAWVEGFANIPGPVTAESKGWVGINANTEGNTVRVTTNSNGSFRGVTVKATGAMGAKCLSPEITLISDTEPPLLKVNSPASVFFVKDRFTVSGSATDAGGIAKIEYSVNEPRAVPQTVAAKKGEEVPEINPEDYEKKWIPIAFERNGAFSVSVDVSSFADGCIPVSVRAFDVTGKRTEFHGAVQKDVTPPEVQVILPDQDAVVNGENTIAFKVKDNGRVSEIQYISADGNRKSAYEIFRTPEQVPESELSDRFNPLRTMNSSMPNLRIGTSDRPIDNAMQISFKDAAGNVTKIDSWNFRVDEESDKPVSEIHLPEELQVVTSDFVITGIVYDDDGPCKTYWKMDSGEWQLVSEELSSSFRIPVPLLSMTDNEHTISAYSVDVNGVKGPEFQRKFRVSLEEPKGALTDPLISRTVKGDVVLRGWASDKNGIGKVQISVDNGATYNDAEGGTEWSYKFDSHVIQDGTHVVFIKIFDGYGIEALYSSQINIDNTPPDIRLELPFDDTRTSKLLFFAGQTMDNIGLTELYITVRSLENKRVPESLIHKKLELSKIISQAVDISELENGFYNVELTGKDAAENVSHLSRNIEIDKTNPISKVSVLYPLNGEHMAGDFNIYGTAYGEKADPIEFVELFIDNERYPGSGQEELTNSGYFKFEIKTGLDEGKKKSSSSEPSPAPVQLAAGVHTYQTVATTKAGVKIYSNMQTFIYRPDGPWVSLDNFTYGDFAKNRPLLKGRAGYRLSDEDKEILKSKDAPSELKEAVAAKKLRRIWLSFDNGKTYRPVGKPGKGTWDYRVENLDIPAGIHFMLIKAEMMNGENAITRTVVQVDRTPPSIRLISPGESMRYNQQLSFEGLSSDDVDLNNVSVYLRKGDKNTYGVPGFIQGLYFDASVWGATLFNVGVGLTAFDNAVKVQLNFGQFTQQQRDMISDLLGEKKTTLRFGGTVIGGKIIAQLAYIPFRYFFGRDWDWLSASLAIGANFSYFTESGAKDKDGKTVSQVLSAVLMQVEFPRITLEKNKYFKSWAFYAEPQLWFIPSDVASDDAKKLVYTTSFGIRTSVF